MEKATLRNIGLQIHLGHDGNPCPTPSGTKKKLVVCHTSGFHHVHVIFCGCNSSGTGFVHQWKQLFRIKWYPATRARPNTAFTFEVLDFYIELSHQAKLNLYDFHKTLDRVTDNSGTVATWVCILSVSRRPSKMTAYHLPSTVIGSCQTQCDSGVI